MKNKGYWIFGIIALLIIFGTYIYFNNFSSENKGNDQNNKITNVQIIKSSLNNDKSQEVVYGYLIYKTKSCSFRSTDLPYPPQSPCAINSGYIILSDNKNAKLANDPTNIKTQLKDNELLIHYVNDYTINSSNLGDYYRVNGEDISYDSILSLEFYGE